MTILPFTFLVFSGRFSQSHRSRRSYRKLWTAATNFTFQTIKSAIFAKNVLKTYENPLPFQKKLILLCVCFS